MQALLASLVVGMTVKDAAFRSAMAANRAEVRKTGQDFERGADRMSGAIDRAAHAVNSAAMHIVDSVGAIGREVQAQGLRLTAGLTLPLGLLAKTAGDTASDFQSAMNRVHAAMATADPADLEKLRDAALTLGPAMGRSAMEAADAIESLAKNGMSAADILNGGLRSALTLGVVGQTDLGKSADLTTDIMQQFGKSARDLPDIVNKVTGALDVSKMNFDDYRLAAGQAGGLVGALGYSFEDFNVALAATAPLFESGADAGTSFRSFLTSLNAKSKEAREEMDRLGLKFYNLDGSARPLAEIAEQLRTKLAGLSDQARNAALDKLFGTDGGRTALALMKKGMEGIEETRRQIGSVTADQKLAILLDGEAAATQRLSTAWERLKIIIGEAGILQFFTMVKTASAATLEALAGLPTGFWKVVVAAGALAAAAGPLLVIAVKLAPVLALLALRGTALSGGFAAAAGAMALLINPLGFVIRLLAGIAAQAGAATVIGRLGISVLGAMGPIGLMTAGATLLYMRLHSLSEVSATATRAQAAMGRITSVAADAISTLERSTGRARDRAMELVKALRAQQIQANATAREMVRLATIEYTKQRKLETSGANTTLIGRVLQLVNGRDRTGAARDLVSASDTFQQGLRSLAALDAAIAAPVALATTSPGATDASPGSGKTSGKSAADIAREAAENEAQYQDDMGQSRVALMQAQADLTGSAQARYRAEVASLDEERAAFARRIALDDGLTDARRSELLAAKDAELATRRQIVEQDRTIALAQESHALASAANAEAQDRVRAEADLADSVSGRRDAELRLLDLQRRQEEADLDLILATKATASAEWANASKRKDALDGIYAERRAQVERQNEGAGAGYLRFLDRSGAAKMEEVAASGVDALKGFNSQLTDAILGTGKLSDAFANMGKRIISTLIDIAIQQAVIKPLAQSLFGGGGGGLLGSLGKIFGGGSGLSGGITSGDMVSTSLLDLGPIALPSFGGGRAKGGGVRSSSWYVVGEEGPEIFAPGVSGTIIPNGGRGAGPGSGGRWVIEPSPWFDVRAASAARPETQAMGVRAAAGGAQLARTQSAQAARRRLSRG